MDNINEENKIDIDDIPREQCRCVNHADTVAIRRVVIRSGPYHVAVVFFCDQCDLVPCNTFDMALDLIEAGTQKIKDAAEAARRAGRVFKPEEGYIGFFFNTKPEDANSEDVIQDESETIN